MKNLYKKKNAVRRDLADRGVLKRGGRNAYDNYAYFSEAQYKQLFTELFAKHGLELSFTELEYQMYSGAGKQSNGRLVKLCFTLADAESGESEETIITGEALDKGDKAGYKAYTGALKYYLANTFLVATSDDPERDSPEVTGAARVSVAGMQPLSAEQAADIEADFTAQEVAYILRKFNAASVAALTQGDYDKIAANRDIIRHNAAVPNAVGAKAAPAKAKSKAEDESKASVKAAKSEEEADA